MLIQEKGKLQAEIQAHRKVAPTVHARPNLELLNKEKEGERNKPKYSFVDRVSGGG